MTANKALTKKEEKTVGVLRKYAVPLLTISTLIIFLLNPEKTSASVLASLTRCARSLIPALFPCTVLSSLIASLGAGDLLGKAFAAPVSFLFGVSKRSSTAILIGMLCGFPVGAAYAATLYKNGYVSRRELEKVIALSSFPSPAFTVNVIGGTFFKSKAVGVYLFLCVILSSLVSALFFRSREEETAFLHLPPKTQSKLGTSVSDALSSSVHAILRLCACVVFFSALSSLIPKSLPDAVRLLLSGALEFSGGCRAAFELYCESSFPVCAAFLGWSGFGVHFQITSLCGDIRYKKYYLISFMKAVLSFVFASVVSFFLFDI